MIFGPKYYVSNGPYYIKKNGRSLCFACRSPNNRIIQTIFSLFKAFILILKSSSSIFERAPARRAPKIRLFHNWNTKFVITLRFNATACQYDHLINSRECTGRSQPFVCCKLLFVSKLCSSCTSDSSSVIVRQQRKEL